MHELMNPDLPRWLNPTPIAPHVRAQCPSAKFEENLQEWKEQRAGELVRDVPPDWGYFTRVMGERIEHTRRDFQTAERARKELRAGCENDLWHVGWNTPPTHHLEAMAVELGWRLAPLGHWAARILNRPDIALDVEAACRAWAHRADAAWIQLKRMPSGKRNLDSHKAMVTPHIVDANMLFIRVWEELGQYGELVDYLRPYYELRP
ncbi:hypothetical protein FJY94_08170 [Candidatus Kaiserbacteria bacterium]|nr:hypothetical protein [Candidatus Kaiserbacteria bacterium]